MKWLMHVETVRQEELILAQKVVVFSMLKGSESLQGLSIKQPELKCHHRWRLRKASGLMNESGTFPLISCPVTCFPYLSLMELMQQLHCFALATATLVA